MSNLPPEVQEAYQNVLNRTSQASLRSQYRVMKLMEDDPLKPKKNLSRQPTASKPKPTIQPKSSSIKNGSIPRPSDFKFDMSDRNSMPLQMTYAHDTAELLGLTVPETYAQEDDFDFEPHSSFFDIGQPMRSSTPIPRTDVPEEFFDLDESLLDFGQPIRSSTPTPRADAQEEVEKMPEPKSFGFGWYLMLGLFYTLLLIYLLEKSGMASRIMEYL